MDRKHLGFFIFLNNIPEDDSLLSVKMLRGGKTKKSKTVRRKTCTVEKAETTYGVDVFYPSLLAVSELDTKQLVCNLPCLVFSSDEIIFIYIEEFRLIDESDKTIMYCKTLK